MMVSLQGMLYALNPRNDLYSLTERLFDSSNPTKNRFALSVSCLAKPLRSVPIGAGVGAAVAALTGDDPMEGFLRGAIGGYLFDMGQLEVRLVFYRGKQDIKTLTACVRRLYN